MKNLNFCGKKIQSKELQFVNIKQKKVQDKKATKATRTKVNLNHAIQIIFSTTCCKPSAHNLKPT